MWPDRLDADPVKKESANSQALKNNTTTLAEIYAKQGKDWEDELMQRSRELQRQRELNLLEELDLPSPSGS
jgi:capsid protein